MVASLCIAVVVKALLGPTYRHNDALTSLRSYKMRIVQVYFLALHTYRSRFLPLDHHVRRVLRILTKLYLDFRPRVATDESHRGSIR